MTTKVQGTNGIEFPDGSVQSSAAYSKAQSDTLDKGPAFSAYPSGVGQSVAYAVWEKVFLFAELFDTADCFDTAAFRFTPNVAGYYQINGAVGTTGAESSGIVSIRCGLYKNGSPVLYGSTGLLTASGDTQSVGSWLVYMNGTTDYLELWCAITGTIRVINPAGNMSYLQGFLARRA